MDSGPGWTLVEGLEVIERELLLFALFWFILGILDELIVDVLWFALRCNPANRTKWLAPDAERARGETASAQPAPARLSGPLAIYVPAWREADVIGATLSHMLASWRERDFVIYVGCYGNDPATLAAAVDAAGQDTRLRLVVHHNHGPTTKADCLNRLYAAMCADEARRGAHFRGVILHDSEDMVHPLELRLIDRALGDVDFVQLPVRPEIPAGGHWVAGHYCDEFTEAHARAMVVRDALGAGLPAAGVGCGFSRAMLENIRQMRGLGTQAGPFAAECLTEDYELGLLIARLGGRSRFLRCRDSQGQLVGTRSYFPDTIGEAVRQKTRWMHGVCLQGWDRLGWHRLAPRPGLPAGGGWIDNWMALRDRRGLLTALVLFAAYLLMVIEGGLALARWYSGAAMPVMIGASPHIRLAMMICGLGFVWRMAMRCAVVTREYGLGEGLRAIVRLPLANVIMIMAARRALFAYCLSLAGGKLVWDKTEHHAHPAMREHAGHLAPGVVQSRAIVPQAVASQAVASQAGVRIASE